MDVKFVQWLAVLTALLTLEGAVADLLTPYIHGNGLTGPWRNHRQIREALESAGFNDTFEETEASDSSIGYNTDYKVHRFVDNLWREDGSRADIMGHLTVVARPLSMLSVVDPYPSGCGHRYWSSRSTVLETAKHRSCDVAMNGGFFKMSGACLGTVVSDRVVSQVGDNKRSPVFAITDGGQIRIGYIDADEIAAGGFRQVVSGVVWLVRNGSSFINHSRMVESADHEETGSMKEFIDVVSARTAIGHDGEGRVMFVHVEGQTRRRGVNLHEFAKLLIDHGFVNAINLDGGGSATTVINDVVASYPSDHCGNPIYRCGRKVSTIICVHKVQCYPRDCSGHGDCKNGVCHCREPFTGLGCELLDCEVAHCSGQGQCKKGICECDAGWTGTHCNISCPDGHYGPDCKEKCVRCSYWASHTVSCDRFNGTWLCQDGFTGQCCKKGCDEGWYGAGCTQRCNCSSHGKCLAKTGKCSCDVGWTGLDCSANRTVSTTTTPLQHGTTTQSVAVDATTTQSVAVNATTTQSVAVNARTHKGVTQLNSTAVSNETRNDNATPKPGSSAVGIPVWLVSIASLAIVLLLCDVIYRRVLRRRCSINRWRRIQESEQLLIEYPGDAAES